MMRVYSTPGALSAYITVLAGIVRAYRADGTPIGGPCPMDDCQFDLPARVASGQYPCVARENHGDEAAA